MKHLNGTPLAPEAALDRLDHFVRLWDYWRNDRVAALAFLNQYIPDYVRYVKGYRLSSYVWGHGRLTTCTCKDYSPWHTCIHLAGLMDTRPELDMHQTV